MNIMGWILLIGLSGNSFMNLGDAQTVYGNKADCELEGKKEMKKYELQAALAHSTPVYKCVWGYKDSDGVYHHDDGNDQ